MAIKYEVKKTRGHRKVPYTLVKLDTTKATEHTNFSIMEPGIGSIKPIIVTINPGSTSTKIAIWNGNDLIETRDISHDKEDWIKLSIKDQKTYRADIVAKTIQEIMKEHNLNEKYVSAVVGRGGLMRPVKSGAYWINKKMLNDLENEFCGKHASNLGAIIAYEVGEMFNVPENRRLVFNPVVVDEMDDEARISGSPIIPIPSRFHALNTKEVGDIAAKNEGKEYKDMNMVIAHLGGGTSICSHLYGQVIDVNLNALGGMITPNRSNISIDLLVEYAFGEAERNLLHAFEIAKNDLFILNNCMDFANCNTPIQPSLDDTKNKILKMIAGNGGVLAMLGTSDIEAITAMVYQEVTALNEIAIDDKHRKAYEILFAQEFENIKNVYNAYIRSITKGIYSAKGIIEGSYDDNVDIVILTGGVAFNNYITNEIIEQNYKIVNDGGKFYVVPGEDEMTALAKGAITILEGAEPMEYYPTG